MSSYTAKVKENTLWKRFSLAYNVQPKKYEKKGVGKYVGYFILVSYFTLFPAILKLIWPLLLEYLPSKVVVGVGMTLINVSILVVYNTVMYFIYTAKSPFFQKYRVNPKPWPWQQNPETWKKQLKNSIIRVTKNVFLYGTPLVLVDSLTSDYKTSIQQIPDTHTMIWQFCLFVLCEDLLFYIGHSTFHRPQFYWIHKQHHEYANTVTIAAEYCHPIEYLLGNAVPVGLGYKVLSYFYPVHAITIFIFVFFRVMETCDGHSGYEWSWSPSELIPFSAGSAYHNFHHSHNVGNYGSFLKFWDTLFNSNIEYIKFRQNKENVKKQ